MDISKKDTITCLRKFGISEQVKDWRILADGPDHPVPYEVIRKIIYVELENAEKYVIKFVWEPMFSTQIIENQCVFSDLLMEHGIDTPRRLVRDGHYCISYEKEGFVMDVYAEEWVGDKVSHLTLEIYEKIGEIIGKIHQVSCETEFHIGFSLLYNEITERDTSFGRLWGAGGHDFISDDEFDAMRTIYDQRLDIVKNIWTMLPRAAVQGDIYSCNNIALRSGKLVVYDFNLAGDEVLIGDILQCWFRTIFDGKIERDLNMLSQEEMWSAFMNAYQREHRLTEIEKNCFSDVYAILGVVYYTKLLNFWLTTGKKKRVYDNYKYLFKLLETKEIQL